jgi:two-component system chemotaxis sensor kinase CheA
MPEFSRISARTLAASALPMPRRGLSITQKLVSLIVLTSSAIVLLLASYLPAQEIGASHAALERKAGTYGRLVAKEVASAIAFDDQETAREIFDSVGEDPDVDSLVLLTAAGETLYARGEPGAWIAAAKRGVIQQRVIELTDRIAVVTPVVSAEGPRGTLVIELSTRGLNAARLTVVRTAAVAGVLALALGALFAYAIARSLGRRLGRIAEVAVAVSAGQLRHAPVIVSGRDEIAQLSHAFNTMLEHIQSLVAQMRRNAEDEQTRLEGEVSARTHELSERNEAMRLVLDNVGQGFFTVDLSGRPSLERSAIVERWLGEPAADDTLFTWIERTFAGRGDYFRVAWEALGEDWMPLEMRLDQLPNEARANGQVIGFTYKPVLEGEDLKRVLVVMTDRTALLEKQRIEEEEQELAQIVRKLLGDRSGFAEFVAEANVLVTAIAQPATALWQRMRHLHTLKGNAGVFGFSSLARLCHELESAVEENQDDVPVGDLARLTAHWARLQQKALTLSETRADILEVSKLDYERLTEQVDAGAAHTRLRSELSTWQLEPTETRLTRVAEYGRSLAQRLGKAPIEIKIEANDVRLDPHAWVGVWQALVHVVRNAVDHGLETPEERAALHKPETAVLVLRTRQVDRTLRLEVEDHGRGVDWNKVALAAKRRGLPAESADDLRDALLADGVSTRDEATETSGRGVGLSAVKEACAQSGGRIAIASEPGRSTTFSFEWTLDGRGRPVLRDELLAQLEQSQAANTNAMKREMYAR